MSEVGMKETIVSGAVVGALMAYCAILTWMISTTTSNMLTVLSYLVIFALCSVFGAFLVSYNWDLQRGWSLQVPLGVLLIFGVPVFLMIRILTTNFLQICVWPLLMSVIGWYAVTRIVRDDAITEYQRHREATAPQRSAKKAEKERRKATEKAVKEAKKQAVQERAAKAAASEGYVKPVKEKTKKEDTASRFKKWLDEGEKKQGGPETAGTAKAKQEATKPEKVSAEETKGALSKFSAWLDEGDKKENDEKGV